MVACSPGFMDFFEFRMDLPFFTDTAPDASLAAEAIPKRPGDSHELKAVPSPVEEALPNKEAVEEDPEMPPVEPLAFTVIPSTAEPVKVASEVALVAASGQEEEMTHENLDRFYRETEAKRPEPKFFLQRYYEGDRTDSSALRTDDGYLTKLGSRLFCMVCFATGHRAQSCPESRCWICFSTGHNVKQCPRTKEKCPMCWRKGHGGDPSETCPFATLKEASRQRNQWSHVRCAACGERGHPMCDGSGKPLLGSRDDLEPPGPRKDETEKARSFADALRGGGSWSNAGRSNWDEQKWHQESWHGSNWKWQNWKEDQWRDHWRNGHNASNGSRSPRHHSQGYQRYGNNSSQHRGGVPSMRIRDAPSARSVQRAAERKRKLR
eukprot:symbB.v1.2.018470.t2/scaffold1468.1/size117071/6